ncbi:MAG: ABC transporter permease [Pseudomonadota bacterium]
MTLLAWVGPSAPRHLVVWQGLGSAEKGGKRLLENNDRQPISLVRNDNGPEDVSARFPRHRRKARGAVSRTILRRLPAGVVTVFAVAVLVYAATLILPGDAATSILGQSATPERLALLRDELNLNVPPIRGFFQWLGGILTGDFGVSLVTREAVLSMVGPKLANSAVLIAVAAVVSVFLGTVLGTLAALYKDSVFDHVLTVVALVASALPEFVVGVLIVLAFAIALPWFPAVSMLGTGQYIWDEPIKLVLPLVTLLIVVTPYIFRMMRASIIEALGSEYVELATLKGVKRSRVVMRHAVPNALPATIQVIGLNILYLAGGIVLVETVFNFPGIGSTLVAAVTARDVPVIQFIVVLLAVFYVALNILTDVLVLIVTPRRRFAR